MERVKQERVIINYSDEEDRRVREEKEEGEVLVNGRGASNVSRVHGRR